MLLSHAGRQRDEVVSIAVCGGGGPLEGRRVWLLLQASGWGGRRQPKMD